jgi:hypothetical protein
MTSKEQVRQEIDEAIARIDANLATAPSDEDVQLQDERLDWERARRQLDESEST